MVQLNIDIRKGKFDGMSYILMTRKVELPIPFEVQ